MGHVQRRCNCNPFGNVATVTSQCVVQDVALVDHADIVYSVCNIFNCSNILTLAQILFHMQLVIDAEQPQFRK